MWRPIATLVPGVASTTLKGMSKRSAKKPLHDSTKFDAMASKPDAEHTELDEAASQKQLLGGGDEDMDEPRFIFVKLPDSRLITVPFHRLSTVLCIATAPLLLTRVFGQCCKAMIHAGTRSPLLPLFAIAATMSAMCEAAAVATSANTDLEKLWSEESSNTTYNSHFPVICNSAKCLNFIENLLLLRFLIIVPVFIVVVATRSRNSATAVEVDERGVAGDLDSPVEETEQQIKDRLGTIEGAYHRTMNNALFHSMDRTLKSNSASVGRDVN